MAEFTFITANDIHISDNGPRARLDDFRATVLDKIGQMRVACEKLNADAAIIAGDLFNLKNPARNSHRLNQDLIVAFRAFPCPVYMIEGNHDLTADSLDSLSEQPLGVLFAAGTLIRLREKTIEKDGVKVSLVGVPYTPDLDLTKLKLPPKGDCVSQVCAMHLYAGMKSGMLFREIMYGYEDIAVLSPDIFVIGHYHIDQGIYEHAGKYFINIGSMTRGTLSEEDISHKPQMGFIRITTDDKGNPSYVVKSIFLKVKPASEIFDLNKKQEEKKESQEIQQFVERLASEAVKNSNTSGSIEEILEKMDTAKAVKDMVMHFINEAKK